MGTKTTGEQGIPMAYSEIKKRSPNMGTKTYPSTFTLLIMMLLKKIPKHGDENNVTG